MNARWTLSLALLGISHAASLSYTGNFAQDDDLLTLNFDLASPATVTLRTWSFAGGVNGAGQAIPAGGFAPVLSLFDALGTQDLLATDHDGGPGVCRPRAPDPASGFCWDAYLNLSLAAGSYLLALTEDDNTPNGPTFPDGFLRAGQGNFTGDEFGGPPGSSLILADGSQRTSFWAVDLSGVDAPSDPLPEPSTGILMLLGAALLSFWCRRRSCRRRHPARIFSAACFPMRTQSGIPIP